MTVQSHKCEWACRHIIAVASSHTYGGSTLFEFCKLSSLTLVFLQIMDEDLFNLKELTERLSRDDIKKLLNALSVPEGVCHWESDATNFLYALKEWTQFNPFSFYQSLNTIRPDLIPIALTIKWLCTDSPVTLTIEPLTIKSFIEMLKNGISSNNLKLLHMRYSKRKSSEDIRFETTMQLIATNNLIQRDMSSLSQLLNSLKLNEMVQRLQPYKTAFQNMEDQEFTSKFKKELIRFGKRIIEWEKSVKIHLETQFRDVKQMLGNDKAVSLEKVYVDLTILKQKPRSVKLEDETTYNEIAYLRKIANKEVEVEPINFTKELKSCDPSKPEIWCFIGNPGCGKTFLCNRTALRFGNNEVSRFSYSLCIPCRKKEWHEMESSRVDAGFPITTEFVCQWLCLGLPVGPSWTTQLAKHITETDGEGLLLIVDSLDEFTKDVPFDKTLLFLLLTRQTLTRSFILLTSRPGAWTDVSTSHHLHISTFFQVLGFSPAQRDLYFEKQFEDTSLFDRCTGLLDRYDEMKQLSLIPVNASLFAALLKSEDGARIHTLTQLYYELTLYLIRRQLDRMGFDELTQVNEICELDSGVVECLPLLSHIHLIYVNSDYVTPEQLFHLLESVEQCSVDCVALNLYSKSSTKVLPYANAIQRTQLSNTKLSLDLIFSKLTETETVKALFSSSANQILSGLSLYYSEFPPDTYSLLTNQISTCQNLQYMHTETSESEVLFSALSSATHFNGLHLYDIPTEYHQQLFSLLPTLSNLREIRWDDYSILPHITHLSTLSYLRIGYYQDTRVNLSDSLLQLLDSNRHSIRVLELWYLEEIGFSSLDGFLRCLQFCTNLVELELRNARISCDDVTLWCSTLHSLTSLLYLDFYHISLSDSGMLSLCRGLLFHPTIKYLYARDCELSSNSCLPLRNLIPTLTQLKYLSVDELSEPETEPIKLLKLTADQYAIKHNLD